MERGSTNDWNRLRRRIYDRDNWQCQSCGRMGNVHGDAQLHAHHIIPRAEGGGDDPCNLLTLCDRCHAEYHENPHLLEDGPPVSPSIRRKLRDWLLIDMLGVAGNDQRASHRAEPAECEQRKARRAEGVNALRDLAKQRVKIGDAAGRVPDFEEGSPPRLYEPSSGGLVMGAVDALSPESLPDCPNCGRDRLVSDWITWYSRGTAKRVTCTSCDALFEERIIERNGRSLVDLEAVESVFHIDTVGSPVGYQLTRPNRSLSEFERRYGSECQACGATESLHYEIVWSRTELLPRRLWVCQTCGTDFSEGPDGLQHTTDPVEAETRTTTRYWYYAIVSLLVLFGFVTLVNPLLILLSGLPLAVSVYKDSQYLRIHAAQTPSIPLWTWGTLVLGVLGAIGYLVNRKRLDTQDSGLHGRQLRRRMYDYVSRFT